MSCLGFTSGQLEREQHALHRLNSAAIALQADALGMRSRLGIDDEALTDARATMSEFAAMLRDALAAGREELSLRTLVARMKEGPKPLGDWLEDLTQLVSTLRSSARVSVDQTAVLDDLVRLIDAGVTEDLYRLYGRR
jgi:hypothetical protein